MRVVSPFCQLTMLASAVAAFALLTEVSIFSARAQAAQAAQPTNPAQPMSVAQPASAAPPATNAADAKADGATSQASPAAGAGQVASVDHANPPPKSLTATAIEKVTEVAKSAGDIFSRVPCLPPKGGARSMGSLPHVASKLAAGEPVMIVAFGSSSTQGYGASSPDFSYPNRLAAQLHRQYPTADITVVNRGKGGEDAPEMMARLQVAVLDLKPDLVIWQVGTNAVLRNLDPDATVELVDEGIAKIQGAGADLVLVDPQYSPRVYERAESANRIVRLLGRVGRVHHIGVFPRFEVMREWHEQRALPIDNFVIADGLHMNDWGYACFAQLLGDDIIKSVGQLKLGVNVPSHVQAYRPM